MALAVLMDRLTKSVAVRAVVVAPYLISSVVAAMIWLWMLEPLQGAVNQFPAIIGLPRQPYLNAPDQAIISLATISTGRHTGFTALQVYAGLQAILKSLYEAARLEGGSE